MGGKRLVVMRHGRAEPYADADEDRQLTDRGRSGAAAAGRYLVSVDAVPDYALVSTAARTRTTWEQVREASGARAEEELSEAMYAASSDSVLESVRLVPENYRTVLFVGHNPAAAYLAHALDDGEGDPDAVRGVLEGFPPAALAIFDVPGGWTDVAEGALRLTHFHVGRG